VPAPSQDFLCKRRPPDETRMEVILDGFKEKIGEEKIGEEKVKF
jgi:hypothetical protein